MGRSRGAKFNSDKGIKYFSKKEKAQLIEEELEDITVEEAIIVDFLRGEAKKVLEATGKGLVVNHVESARELIKLF